MTRRSPWTLVLGVLTVAAVGVLVALVVAPTSTADPAPAVRTVTVTRVPASCTAALGAGSVLADDVGRLLLVDGRVRASSLARAVLVFRAGVKACEASR